jgi:glycosyltransferase involved in cell wall biosynthesis
MPAPPRPPAILLDLTRLASRAGYAVDTGIDRVERAWLDRLASLPGPICALVRTRLGFLLLDRKGLGGVAPRLQRLTPGRGALAGRLRRARLFGAMRVQARARCRPAGLGAMLRAYLPDGTVYLNVGHSNLEDSVFRAVHSVEGARCAALIHDVIPLDRPDLCRAGTEASFARRLHAVGAHADLAIYTTRAVADAAERHLGHLGRIPPAVIAPLAAPPVRPDVSLLPRRLPLDRPYFLTVGTIEPRKNHALLLDIWDGFHARLPAPDIPRLFILGARGWADAALLYRDETVFEIPGLPDAAIAALMQKTAGLLFPSLAEGFGLPPLEAAQAGAPVVCNDLAVYRETLGDYPVYAPVTDRYPWERAITDLAQGLGTPSKGFKGPDWADHFNPVLSRM